MKAIVCDKCGKVVTNKKELEDVFALNTSTAKVGKLTERHFCDECMKKFIKWLGYK